VATLPERHTSRTRWLVIGGIAAALIVAIVLIAMFAGGGGSAPGY